MLSGWGSESSQVREFCHCSSPTSWAHGVRDGGRGGVRLEGIEEIARITLAWGSSSARSQPSVGRDGRGLRRSRGTALPAKASGERLETPSMGDPQSAQRDLGW